MTEKIDSGGAEALHDLLDEFADTFNVNQAGFYARPEADRKAARAAIVAHFQASHERGSSSSNLAERLRKEADEQESRGELACAYLLMEAAWALNPVPNRRGVSDAEVDARQAGVREGLSHAINILWATPCEAHGPAADGRDRLRALVGERLTFVRDNINTPPTQKCSTHPLASEGEPWDCTRCNGACMTPAAWPGCYTPPPKAESRGSSE